MHHPKTPFMKFHGWDEIIPQTLVYLVSMCIFLSFFCGPPLTPSFVLGSSYLPQPTYLPHHADPFPTPPPFAFTSVVKAFDLERAWIVQNFKSVKSIGVSRVGSFRSALTKGASWWWQKWELQGKLLSPLAFLFFAFFLMWKNWQWCHHHLLLFLLLHNTTLLKLGKQWYQLH